MSTSDTPGSPEGTPEGSPAPASPDAARAAAARAELARAEAAAAEAEAKIAAAKAARLEARAALKARPRWQKLLGVRRRPGKRIKWGLTLWGMVLVVMLVGGGGMGAFAEYSMTADFCRSCHLMEPYYQAWHASKHKDVPCVDCHFEPGLANTIYGKFQASSQAIKYITNTYGSKPHAQISDKSCMRSRCHESRVLQGKVDWKVPSERRIKKTTVLANGSTLVTEEPGEVTIKFDHTPHLTEGRRLGSKLKCVSCHSQLVQGRHIVVTTDTCFLCHFKGQKHGRDDATVATCRGCHEAPKSELVLATGVFRHTDYVNRPGPEGGVKCENCHADTVRGDGRVPQQACWNCHNQTAQIARYPETKMIHDRHVTEHKVECTSCHAQIEHSLVAGAREEVETHRKLTLDSGQCGLCHEQTHLGPREMYQGIGGKLPANPDGSPAKAMPSSMARVRVNCIGCHMQKKRDDQTADVAGQTFAASQERCDYCHQNKYKGKLDEWRKSIAEAQLKADTAYAQAQTARTSAKLSPTVALEVDTLLKDAAHNIRFVKLAHGVHNVSYALGLLNSAATWSDQASAKMKAAAEKP